MFSFIIGLLLFGGFYDFSVSATAVCVVAEILFHYYKKKPVYQKKKNYILWIPAVLTGWIAVVSLWALDASENMLGIMRGVVVLLWMYRCFLMDEEEKQNIFTAIPYMGAGMVLIGMVSLVNDDLAAKFWQASRLGGFFQYANTSALFLVIGVILLTRQLTGENDLNGRTGKRTVIKNTRQKNILQAVVMGILIVGIFLTGSRSVLLVLLLWGIYKMIQVKKLRMPFILVTAVCLLIAGGYGLLSGNEQNIARIFTIFESNSTILGRILYDIDALSISAEHPFGLGYMGYYYIQPAVQTGVYTTRFIHNDLLQVLVDYGIPALILVLLYLGYQIIKGKQEKWKKELLVVLLVASLVDFHLQYISMLMLAALCLDLGEKNGIKKKKELQGSKILFAVSALIFSYFTIAFGAYYFENAALSLELFPKYTEAQIQVMNSSQDREEAVWMAEDILSRNIYVADAYHVKIYEAAMEGDYLSVTEYMDRSLAIKRYDAATYQNYEMLLNEVINICESAGNAQEAERLTSYKNALPGRLAALEQETNPIAFKLRDKPVFTW